MSQGQNYHSWEVVPSWLVLSKEYDQKRGWGPLRYVRREREPQVMGTIHVKIYRKDSEHLRELGLAITPRWTPLRLPCPGGSQYILTEVLIENSLSECLLPVDNVTVSPSRRLLSFQQISLWPQSRLCVARTLGLPKKFSSDLGWGQCSPINFKNWPFNCAIKYNSLKILK